MHKLKSEKLKKKKKKKRAEFYINTGMNTGDSTSEYDITCHNKGL